MCVLRPTDDVGLFLSVLSVKRGAGHQLGHRWVVERDTYREARTGCTGWLLLKRDTQLKK